MTVEATIGTGQDYATPALWEAAIPSNPTEGYTGTCQVDETYEGMLLFRGNNTNDVPIILDVASGVRHNFQRGTGARQTKTTGDSNAALHLDMDQVTVRNFGVYSSGGASTRYSVNFGPSTQAVTALTLENCFIDREGNEAPCINYQNGDTGAAYTMRSCAISHHDGSIIFELVEKNASVTWTLQNCSILADNLSTYVFNSNIGSGTDTLVINDCKILQSGGAGALFNTGAGGVYTGSNNVISEASAPSGLGVLAGGFGVSQSASDHYTSADGSAPDLSIKSTLTKSSYIGSDTLAGNTDAEGDSWVASYCDVGCDAESSAASAATPAPQRGGLRLGLRLGM